MCDRGAPSPPPTRRRRRPARPAAGKPGASLARDSATPGQGWPRGPPILRRGAPLGPDGRARPLAPAAGALVVLSVRRGVLAPPQTGRRCGRARL